LWLFSIVAKCVVYCQSWLFSVVAKCVVYCQPWLFSVVAECVVYCQSWLFSVVAEYVVYCQPMGPRLRIAEKIVVNGQHIGHRQLPNSVGTDNCPTV